MAQLKHYTTTKTTALSGSHTSNTTTLTLVDGSTYPDPTVVGNGPYSVIVGYGSDREEVCTVTGKPATNQLTVTRGQDGSSATAKNSGDVVVHGVSARDFDLAALVAEAITVSTNAASGTPGDSQVVWIQV